MLKDCVVDDLCVAVLSDEGEGVTLLTAILVSPNLECGFVIFAVGVFYPHALGIFIWHFQIVADFLTEAHEGLYSEVCSVTEVVLYVSQHDFYGLMVDVFFSSKRLPEDGQGVL